MGQVRQRPVARRDLLQHFVSLAEHADLATADRFLNHAYESFQDLARHPEMGPAVQLRDPKLKAIRRWQVRDFEKFLIFYEPRPDGVSIVRVLHAAQDWWSLLGVE
jgi:toxin ParE1/3/4